MRSWLLFDLPLGSIFYLVDSFSSLVLIFVISTRCGMRVVDLVQVWCIGVPHWLEVRGAFDLVNCTSLWHGLGKGFSICLWEPLPLWELWDLVILIGCIIISTYMRINFLALKLYKWHLIVSLVFPLFSSYVELSVNQCVWFASWILFGQYVWFILILCGSLWFLCDTLSKLYSYWILKVPCMHI